MVLSSAFASDMPGILAKAFISRRLISPNIHVILVHFPLGVFVLGMSLEIFSFLWRRSSVRLAARWMILLGALMAVPTALTGIDALQDASANGVYRTEDGLHSLSPDQWFYMQKHVWITSMGTAVAAITVTIGLGLSDRWRRRLYIPLLLLLVAACGALTFGSHFGGEGIYLEGVAVQLRGKPAIGYEYFAPARSVHVLMAGLAIAVSLGALGSSMRAISVARRADNDLDDEAELAALIPGTPPPPPRRVTDDISVARSLNADAGYPARRVPASRFWLLGAMLFLLSLALGLWLLEVQELGRAPREIIPKLRGDVLSLVTGQVWLQNRRGAHILLGTALVVLPLILAVVVRWMTRSRVITGFLCLLIAMMMAAEIWLGVLLVYRGTNGSIYRYEQTETLLVRPIS